MIKDITLGQYFPGNSVIHKIDPRMKIIIVLLFIISVFFASNSLSFALLLLGVILTCLISRISAKILLKSLKPIIFIAAFTAFFNIFFTVGDHLLLSFWIINIYLEGIENAVFMVIRIVSLVMGTSVLLTYTTSPVELTDGLERLLSPLNKIKVPVHVFAMMMTLALRFIPTLIEETDKIMSAQKARGADFESGSLAKRIKAIIPIIIPLFFSSFRRAEELATAMDCRLYRGGEGRTKMKVLHLKVLDFFALLIMIVFLAVLIGAGYVG